MIKHSLTCTEKIQSKSRKIYFFFHVTQKCLMLELSCKNVKVHPSVYIAMTKKIQNPFHVMFTSTFQGLSGTQGNPVKFTSIIFAVW